MSELATPPNFSNTKLPQGNTTATAEGNYTVISVGNDHGRLYFGQVHKDGATTSSCLLQAADGRHHIALDKSGERVGSTQIVGPSRLSIRHGDESKEAEISIMIESVNGELVIKSSNGKLRLEGTDIELTATGEGGSKGNIRLNANENIELKAQNKININAATAYNIVTPGTASVIANGAMTLYGSIIRGVTDAVTQKDSKVGGLDVVMKYSKGC